MKKLKMVATIFGHYIWLEIFHIESIRTPEARFEICMLWVAVKVEEGIAISYSVSEGIS